MPALTFTADSTTDQLTITGHGLTTGDGPATPYTVTGTLPTGTPAIAALTDYWIVVIDANHVKLAISQANALAGTPTINILTNGSGTLQLLVGLPYRPARTYAVGSQVKSVDLNSMFTDWVALWNLLTHQTQTLFPTETIAVPHASPGFTGSAADNAATVPAGTSAPSGRHMPISGLAATRVITAVRARVADDGPTDKLVVLLTMYDPGTTGGPPAADGNPPQSNAQDIAGTTSAASAGSGVTETISKTGLAIKIVTGVTYNVCVRKSNGSATTTRVLHVEIDVL